jgi:hypothetical protein
LAVAVGALVSYCAAVHVLRAEQARFEVDAGAVLSYWLVRHTASDAQVASAPVGEAAVRVYTPPLFGHTVEAPQPRSLLAPGALDSY